MKRHNFAVSRLIFGLVFIVVGIGWFPLWDNGAIPLNSLIFVLPLLLIGLGTIGLISTLGIGKRGEKTDSTTE